MVVFEAEGVGEELLHHAFLVETKEAGVVTLRKWDFKRIAKPMNRFISLRRQLLHGKKIGCDHIKVDLILLVKGIDVAGDVQVVIILLDLAPLGDMTELRDQGQRTLSPLSVKNLEECVEVPAAASALHGQAFACGMWF